jgi:hypothetical protein
MAVWALMGKERKEPSTFLRDGQSGSGHLQTFGKSKGMSASLIGRRGQALLD